jgi:cystathionine beta-lyase
MTHNFDQLIDRRQTNSIKWNLYAEDVLPMWVADMDFQAPPPIIDALRRAVEHGIFGYEFPNKKLKQTVANRMKVLYNWDVDPDWIVATPGVINAYNLAAEVTCDAGDGMLIQPPVYHPFFAVYENLPIKEQTAMLALKEHDRIQRYAIDFDVFRSAFHSNNARTKLFLLCNPHNPAGRAFTKDELTRMAEICLENDTAICSDEIHSELLLGDTKHLPIASLSKPIEDRTITIIAPSKTYNVPGLYTAFAIIANAELRHKFMKAFERRTDHVALLGLIAAETAYSGACDAWLNDLRSYLTINRDAVTTFVIDHLPEVKTTIPEATYLAYLDFRALVSSGVISGKPIDHFIEKGKVALNDGDIFRGEKGFLRLNFGCPRSTLMDGLERIKRAI